MKSQYLLECCVDSVESAVYAKEGGADRLELCSNLIIGGTTPGLALFRRIRETVDLPIRVLIRPRFGDFLYSPADFEILKKEVELFRHEQADGIVIGCLTPEGSLDLARMTALMELAGPLPVTLHRAFDMTKDPFQALSQAKALGIDTILTSGQAACCLEGISLLKELTAAAKGDVTILAGAGINAETVKQLLERTAVAAFHMSGKKTLQSRMEYRNPTVSMGLPGISEYEIWQTDPDEIRRVRRLLSYSSGF